MKKQRVWRFVVYLAGLMTLALGLSLTAKSGLGASALSSPAYFASQVWGFPYGNCMLVLYLIFITGQLILNPPGEKMKVLPQIVVSLVFSQAMNGLMVILPSPPEPLWGKLLMLAVAFVCTGTGVSLSLDAKLFPNPGEGIVASLAQFTGIQLGLMKNIVDFSCMTLTFVMGIVTGHFMCAIGIGTLLGVIVVGRVVSVFNGLFKAKLDGLMGMEP